MTRRAIYIASTLVCASLVAGVGVLTLTWATHGFQVWTAEDARRLQVLANDKEVPTDELLNHLGIQRTIAKEGRIVVLDFIYTRCPTVCNTLGVKFQRLQNYLLERKIANQVELVSISFDIEHDTPIALDRYLKLHKANPTIWTALIPRSKAFLEQLKHRFGLVIINDEYGGFIHNTAIYVIKDNRILKIFNDDEIYASVSYAETLIKGDEPTM